MYFYGFVTFILECIHPFEFSSVPFACKENQQNANTLYCNCLNLFYFLNWTHHDKHNFRGDIEKFFSERDRDFDGRLSLEEFLGEETQIEKLFRLMDKNKDGFVTKKVMKYECLMLSTSSHHEVDRHYIVS